MRVYNPQKQLEYPPRILLYANSSAGKTTLAATTADLGNTLYIDVGSQPHIIAQTEYKHELTILTVEGFNDLEQIRNFLIHRTKSNTVYKMLKRAGKTTDYKWVIIDNLSVLQRIYMSSMLGDTDTPTFNAMKGKLDKYPDKVMRDDFGTLLSWSMLLFNSLRYTQYGLVTVCYETAVPTPIGNKQFKYHFEPSLIGQSRNLIAGGHDIIGRVSMASTGIKVQLSSKDDTMVSDRYNKKRRTYVQKATISKLMGGD